MNKYLTLLALLLFYVTLNAQTIKKTDLNREYTFNDSLLWNGYEKKMDLIFKNTPNKEERKNLLKILQDSVEIQNRNLAVKYKNTERGMQRLFMTRNGFNKKDLSNILKDVTEEIMTSEDYKALMKHISINQIQLGDPIPNISFRNSDNEVVSFQKDINNIIIYAAFATTDCMGTKNRNSLNEIMNDESFNKRNKIYLFYNSSDINDLQKARSKFNDNLTYISDLSGSFSDFRILTGSQASPIIYLFDKNGKLKTIELGVEYILENAESLK